MILGLLVEQSINSGLSFWISNDVSGRKQNGTFARISHQLILYGI